MATGRRAGTRNCTEAEAGRHEQTPHKTDDGVLRTTTDAREARSDTSGRSDGTFAGVQETTPTELNINGRFDNYGKTGVTVWRQSMMLKVKTTV